MRTTKYFVYKNIVRGDLTFPCLLYTHWNKHIRSAHIWSECAVSKKKGFVLVLL